MSIRAQLLIALWLFLAPIPIAAHASPTQPAPCACDTAFASHLRDTGDWSAAQLEFRRAAWRLRECGQFEASHLALMQACEILLSAGRSQECINVLHADPEYRQGSTESILMARAWMALGRPDIAYSELQSVLASQSSDTPVTLDALYQQTIVMLQLGLEDSASVRLQYFPRSDPRSAKCILALQRLSHLPRKSPLRATLIGVIPGAGYAYAGHPQTGLTALATIGCTLMASQFAYHRGQSGFGGFMLGLAAVWYGGSIYGSYQSAQNWNDWRLESTISSLNP